MIFFRDNVDEVYVEPNAVLNPSAVTSFSIENVISDDPAILRKTWLSCVYDKIVTTCSNIWVFIFVVIFVVILFHI